MILRSFAAWVVAGGLLALWVGDAKAGDTIRLGGNPQAAAVTLGTKDVDAPIVPVWCCFKRCCRPLCCRPAYCCPPPAVYQQPCYASYAQPAYTSGPAYQQPANYYRPPAQDGYTQVIVAAPRRSSIGETYRYDGGPQYPVPLPKGEMTPTKAQSVNKVVSLRAKPARFSYAAYGEEPWRTSAK